jgi:hypothetical protein
MPQQGKKIGRIPLRVFRKTMITYTSLVSTLSKQVHLLAISSRLEVNRKAEA